MNNPIALRTDAAPDQDSIEALYRDAGWTAYLKDLPLLIEAHRHSMLIITAWDGDQLAGLIRVVGDGLTIIHIQDLLVLTEYRRRGIGTQLVRAVLERYSHVRQKVLLADDAPNIRTFYERLGFESCDRKGLMSFVRFN